MIARKCDICGNLYESYNIKNSKKDWNALSFYNRDEYNRHFSHDIMDLCPGCQKSIADVMEMLKEKQND